jgi:hypothetical protein
MKAKAMSLGASMFVMALLLFPTGAYAQFGGIFSAILSTITGPIGGALPQRRFGHPGGIWPRRLARRCT